MTALIIPSLSSLPRPHLFAWLLVYMCMCVCVLVAAVPAYRKRTDPKVWLVLNRLYSRWQVQDGSDTALNARRYPFSK